MRNSRRGAIVALAAVAVAVVIGIAIWLGFLAASGSTDAHLEQSFALVTANRLNCRAEPSPESEVVGVAGRDERLVVHEEQGPWRRVSLRGASCWVSSEYLQLTSL